MREIKFRAYLKDSKQVVEVRHISFFKGETVVKVYDEPMDIEVWFDLEDLEFLQYTGLKDKNGIEIYEGDVIRFILGDYNIREYVEEVVYSDGAFWCGNWLLFDAKVNDDDLEVLGNSYENPELLERDN